MRYSSSLLSAVLLANLASAAFVSTEIWKKTPTVRSSPAGSDLIAGHLQSRGVAELPMGDLDGDVGYFATLQIGTPPMQYTFQLDTGSAALLVAGVGLAGDRKVLYDPARSSTSTDFKKTFGSTFLDGSGNYGNLYSDIVSFGSSLSARTNVSAYNSATPNQYGATLAGLGVDGLLGFVPSGGQAENGNSFIENLFLTSKLDSPEFGFAFARQVGTSNENAVKSSGGYLMIGGVNSTFFNGDLEYVPVCKPPSGGSGSYWSILLTGITVNGASTRAKIAPTCIVLDTGSTQAILTPDLASALYSMIPGAVPTTSGRSYIFPCAGAQGVTVGLTFGSRTYNIAPIDFVAQTDGVRCLGSIVVGGQVLLGDIFLKNVYASFRLSDPPAIGLAALHDPNNLLGSSPIHSETQAFLPAEANAVPSNSTSSPARIDPIASSTSKTAAPTATSIFTTRATYTLESTTITTTKTEVTASALTTLPSATAAAPVKSSSATALEFASGLSPLFALSVVLLIV